jgi:superfamily II DNA or RNA helicase
MFDTQKANGEKAKFQQEFQYMAEDEKAVLLSAATGTGKTRAVLNVIAADTSGLKWLVLVPEEIQIVNLIREITDSGFSHLLDRKIEEIICYASFKKWEGKKLNLWFNEAHRLSELREDIAKTVKFERYIADSASVPHDVRQRLWNVCPFEEFELTLSQAIERGILPEPSVRVMYINVDDRYAKNTAKYGDFKKKVTDRQYIDYLEKGMEHWLGKAVEMKKKGQDNKWAFNKMNQLGSERKKFVASIKTEAIQKLIEKLGDKRFICYTGSLEQCDELGKERAVHSKKTKGHNLSIIEKFNNFLINCFYLVKMGKEGLNLNGIKAVILSQLSSGKDEGLDFIQSAGRGMRSESPEIYIFVARDTMDERYLKRALANIDKQYITYE